MPKNTISQVTNETTIKYVQQVTPNEPWMTQSGVAKASDIVRLEQAIDAGGTEAGDVALALNTHISDTNNPHGVTIEKIGAAPASLSERVAANKNELDTKVDGHISNTENPHGITPEKIGAAKAVHDHNVADVIGALTIEDLNEHAENTNNPHGVTPAQIGAAEKVHTHKLVDIEKGSDLVYYEHFGTGRKTIQLRNYDNISGLDTNGVGANLIMVSKWDVADIASPQLHTNLNTKDTITINDDKVVATVDQIPDISNLATKAELPDVSNFATIDQIPDTTTFATKDDIKDQVTTTSFGPLFTDNMATAELSIAQVTDYVAPTIPTKLPNPNALTIKYNGATAFTYDGSTAETGNFVVTTETVPGMENYLKTADANTTFATKVEVAEHQTAAQVLTAIQENAITSISAERLLTSDKVDFKDGDKVLYSLTLPYVKFTPQSCFIANEIATFFADFGPAATPDTIDQMSWDAVVANKEGIYANINTVADLTVENGPYLVLLGTSSTGSEIKLHSYVMLLKPVLPNTNTLSGDVKAISDRLLIMESQISDLKKTNIVPVAITSGANLDQPDADMVITTGDTVLTGVKAINAKSIDVKSMEASNSSVGMTATNDITIQSLAMNGDLPQATSNAQLKVNTSEYVKITKSTFAQTGYNAVEIGLQTAPKNVIIDGLDFTVPLSNNAILIFQHQDNAVITISNCHFVDVSNAVRISNKLNKRATVNFINCTVDKWDARPEWSGFLIMQDYSSGTVELEEANNLFAPDKLTINFINCTGPGGKVIKPTNLSEVCGTKDNNQLIYVWNSKGGTIPYGDGSRYPTFTFK